MTNIISLYYQGIVQQLRSEVDSINNLFQHQGVKGGGNEDALRELLTKFIPKRFGVGTGVVIDRNGKQSRQCDIVIYDTMLYPSLLSLTNVHFFPVDIVYATVEVKTTLTSSSVKEALENIASVKQLDFIPDKFVSGESTGDSFSFVSHTPAPPLGFIFAYNSEANQYETFKKWFIPTSNDQILNLPVAVGCLDQGLIFLSKDNKWLIYPEIGLQIKGWLLPLMDNQMKHIEFQEEKANYTHNNHVYPIKRFQGKYVVIDQSRVLLLFLLILQEMLSRKRINSATSFVNTYFRDQPINSGYEI